MAVLLTRELMSLNISGPIHSEFDVVVIGGGPAGTSAAISLRNQDASVLVVERSNYEHLRFGETFPPAIQHSLKQLGLWQDFLAANHLRSIGIRSIWGSNQPHDQSFMLNPYAEGWHVDRRAFDAFLARSAHERGVDLAVDCGLVKCERSSDGGWELLLSVCEKLVAVRAKFVVDATGRTCVLSLKLGSHRIIYDRLVGTYGFFTGTSDHDASLTLLEAVEDGWWYSAPLPSGYHVVAFMTDSDLCARLRLRNVLDWQARLDRAPHTKARIGSLEFRGRVNVLPANSAHLDRACGHRWLAIGDAAISLDPLSGDGVLRALKSGLEAAEIIAANLSGDDLALPRYQLAREQDFRSYLRQRETYYQRESRWSNAPFWSRRHKPQQAQFDLERRKAVSQVGKVKIEAPTFDCHVDAVGDSTALDAAPGSFASDSLR